MIDRREASCVLSLQQAADYLKVSKAHLSVSVR